MRPSQRGTKNSSKLLRSHQWTTGKTGQVRPHPTPSVGSSLEPRYIKELQYGLRLLQTPSWVALVSGPWCSSLSLRWKSASFLCLQLVSLKSVRASWMGVSNNDHSSGGEKKEKRKEEEEKGGSKVYGAPLKTSETKRWISFKQMAFMMVGLFGWGEGRSELLQATFRGRKADWAGCVCYKEGVRVRFPRNT